MGKVCVRCGYERKETDQAPEGECPSCGVIYARAEASPPSAQARAMSGELRASRLHRDHQEKDRGGFFAFGVMITPMLARVIFILGTVLLLVGVVFGFVRGNAGVVIGGLASILLLRLTLEGVMVIFRLAEDVAKIRALLADEAIARARRDGQQR